VPDEKTAGLQDAGELANDRDIIRRMGEEAERRKEVEHGVESSRPASGHFPHVATRVPERAAGASPACDIEQIPRVVETIDVKAVLGEEMGVPSLTARHIENTRTDRQRQELDETRCFLPVALGCEERAVLQQIVVVERGLPPLARPGQKNTGSR
jgi:hypothetical protein